MRLQYDVAIVGLAAVSRALKTVERRFVRHNQILRKRAAALDTSTSGIATEKKRHAQVMKNLGKERAAARRVHAMSGSAAVAAERRRHTLAMRNARSEAAARRSFARTVVGGVRRRVGSVVRSVGAFGATAIGLGGGMLAAGALRSQMGAEREAVGLANQAMGTPDQRGRSREQLQKLIMDRANAVALSTGFTREDLIKSARAFGEKAGGGVDIGVPLISEFADLAHAHGANIQDVGRAGGNIYQAAQAQMEMPIEQAQALTRDLLASMAGMGKVGAIEFSDMAAQAGKFMSAAGQFASNPEEFKRAAQTTMAMGQLALAGGAATPQEAGTAVMRFGDDAAKRYKRFEDLGVEVFTDRTRQRMRAPEEILFDALEESGGSIPQMMKLFGLRGQKGARPLQQLATSIRDLGGGSLKEGIAVARGKLEKMRSASEDPEMTRASAAAHRATLEGRMAKIRERLNQRLAPAVVRVVERLLPALESMIPHLETAADALATFIEAFADNPYAGIGAIIAAAVTAEIGKAALGSVLTKLLESILRGAVPGMLPPPAVPPAVPPSTLGRVGAAIGTVGRTVLGGPLGLIGAASAVGFGIVTAGMATRYKGLEEFHPEAYASDEEQWGPYHDVDLGPDYLQTPEGAKYLGSDPEMGDLTGKPGEVFRSLEEDAAEGFSPETKGFSFHRDMEAKARVSGIFQGGSGVDDSSEKHSAAAAKHETAAINLSLAADQLKTAATELKSSNRGPDPTEPR